VSPEESNSGAPGESAWQRLAPSGMIVYVAHTSDATVGCITTRGINLVADSFH